MFVGLEFCIVGNLVLLLLLEFIILPHHKICNIILHQLLSLLHIRMYLFEEPSVTVK